MELVQNSTNRSWSALNVTNTSSANTQVHLSDVIDEGFISDETLESFITVFLWMMPLLCLLAVIFCIFNAAVYWQQRAATFAVYLVAVDLGDGLCSFVELLHCFTFFTLPENSYSHLFVKWYVAKYFAASCRRAAVCLNAFASMERFLAIAFPLKSVSRRMCGKPGIIITLMFVTSLGAHVYFALEYEVERTDEGGWKLVHTDWRKESPEVFSMWAVVDSIVFAYSPLVAIIVLNVTLLTVLRHHATSIRSMRRTRGKETSQSSSLNSSTAAHHHSSGSISVSAEVTENKAASKKPENKKERENQTVKMVMVFTTVVLIMALPRMLNSSARTIYPAYGPQGKEKNLYNAINRLSQITSHLTETALFWVSFAYSRHFRRAVFRLPVVRWLCGPWLAKLSLPATSSSDVSSSTRGTSAWSRNESQ